MGRTKGRRRADNGQHRATRPPTTARPTYSSPHPPSCPPSAGARLSGASLEILPSPALGKTFFSYLRRFEAVAKEAMLPESGTKVLNLPEGSPGL